MEESDRITVLAKVLQAQPLEAIGLQRFLKHLADCSEVRAGSESFGSAANARFVGYDLAAPSRGFEKIRKLRITQARNADHDAEQQREKRGHKQFFIEQDGEARADKCGGDCV